MILCINVLVPFKGGIFVINTSIRDVQITVLCNYELGLYLMNISLNYETSLAKEINGLLESWLSQRVKLFFCDH